MEAETFKVPHKVQMNEAETFKKKFPGHGAPKQSDFLRKKLHGKGGNKYFDSGDYMMAKSTKKKDATIVTGKAIPTPEALPQRKPSATKQSNLLSCEERDPNPAESSNDNSEVEKIEPDEKCKLAGN